MHLMSAALIHAGLVVALAAPRMLSAQAPLKDVVERARTAWLGHATQDLVAGSDIVRLRIPGVAVSQALRPGQAARLLARYLADADGEELVLREIRHVAEDHAYAEMARRYTVRGTSDERVEMLFFGFRIVGGEWRLREVRVAP